jgi:hypothetical protein
MRELNRYEVERMTELTPKVDPVRLLKDAADRIEAFISAGEIPDDVLRIVAGALDAARDIAEGNLSAIQRLSRRANAVYLNTMRQNMNAANGDVTQFNDRQREHLPQLLLATRELLRGLEAAIKYFLVLKVRQKGGNTTVSPKSYLQELQHWVECAVERVSVTAGRS